MNLVHATQENNPLLGLLAACAATAPPSFAVELPFPGSDDHLIGMGLRDIVVSPSSEMPGLRSVHIERIGYDHVILTSSLIQNDIGVMTKLEALVVREPLAPPGVSWGMHSRLMKRSVPGMARFPQWESAIVEHAFMHALRTTSQDDPSYQALIDATTAPVQLANVVGIGLGTLIGDRLRKASRNGVTPWIVDAVTCWLSWRMAGSVAENVSRDAFWRLVHGYHKNVHPIAE